MNEKIIVINLVIRALCILKYWVCVALGIFTFNNHFLVVRYDMFLYVPADYPLFGK